MVLKPGREAEAEAIFRKWELDFAVIGEVTDTGHMVLEFDGEVVCDIPLGSLADEAPCYERPYVSQDEYKAWAGVKPLVVHVPGADDGKPSSTTDRNISATVQRRRRILPQSGLPSTRVAGVGTAENPDRSGRPAFDRLAQEKPACEQPF